MFLCFLFLILFRFHFVYPNQTVALLCVANEDLCPSDSHHRGIGLAWPCGYWLFCCTAGVLALGLIGWLG